MKKNADGTDTVLEPIDSFTFGEEPDEPTPTETEAAPAAEPVTKVVTIAQDLAASGNIDVTATIEGLVKAIDVQAGADGAVRATLRDQLVGALTKALGIGETPTAPAVAPPPAAEPPPAVEPPAPVEAAPVAKDQPATAPPSEPAVPPAPPTEAATTEEPIDKARHMAQTAQEAAERLMSVAARAKEKGPDPRLIREVKAIAAMLGSMIEKYPSPKSMSEDDFLGLVDELERRIEGYRKAAMPAPVTKSEEPAEAVALRKTVEEQGTKLAQQDTTIADLRQQVAKLAAEPATPASRREVASPETSGEFVWPSDLADDERAQAAGLR